MNDVIKKLIIFHFPSLHTNSKDYNMLFCRIFYTLLQSAYPLEKRHFEFQCSLYIMLQKILGAVIFTKAA